MSEDSSYEDAGPNNGRINRGTQESESVRRAQVVMALGDKQKRAGQTLVTTHHGVIRRWTDQRGGKPATVAGTEHGNQLGVLRIDFNDRSDLRHVSWDEWFATFDDRGLNFLYQETRADGTNSTFFRLENPSREDA